MQVASYGPPPRFGQWEELREHLGGAGRLLRGTGARLDLLACNGEIGIVVCYRLHVAKMDAGEGIGQSGIGKAGEKKNRAAIVVCQKSFPVRGLFRL